MWVGRGEDAGVPVQLFFVDNLLLLVIHTLQLDHDFYSNFRWKRIEESLISTRRTGLRLSLYALFFPETKQGYGITTSWP